MTARPGAGGRGREVPAADWGSRVSTNSVIATLGALSSAVVEFVVCGGVACVLQGVARATHDLDLLVALDLPAEEPQ